MKEIVKVLLAEGIDEETIHEVLNVLETNIESVKNVWRGRTGTADNEFNDYVKARRDEMNVENSKDKDERRKAHITANNQENNVLAADHKVHKTKELIKKWAKKFGKNINFKEPEERVPGADAGSDMVVDGERVTNRKRNIEPEVLHSIKKQKKKQQPYQAVINWEGETP